MTAHTMKMLALHAALSATERVFQLVRRSYLTVRHALKVTDSIDTMNVWERLSVTFKMLVVRRWYVHNVCAFITVFRLYKTNSSNHSAALNCRLVCNNNTPGNALSVWGCLRLEVGGLQVSERMRGQAFNFSGQCFRKIGLDSGICLRKWWWYFFIVLDWLPLLNTSHPAPLNYGVPQGSAHNLLYFSFHII